MFLKNEKSKFETESDLVLIDQILTQFDRTQVRLRQEVLYSRYVDKVYSKCQFILKNETTAKDLTHDVMIKILTNLPSFKQKSSFYSWAMAITYNHCISYLEKEKKIVSGEQESQRYLSDDAAADYELKMLQEEQLELLEKTVNQLPAEERLVLMMRYQDGLSIKEIARYLSLGESAVKMRLKRTRSKIGDALKSI